MARTRSGSRKTNVPAPAEETTDPGPAILPMMEIPDVDPGLDELIELYREAGEICLEGFEQGETLTVLLMDEAGGEGHDLVLKGHSTSTLIRAQHVVGLAPVVIDQYAIATTTETIHRKKLWPILAVLAGRRGKGGAVYVQQRFKIDARGKVKTVGDPIYEPSPNLLLHNPWTPTDGP